jgi:hypothetical protein
MINKTPLPFWEAALLFERPVSGPMIGNGQRKHASDILSRLIPPLH